MNPQSYPEAKLGQHLTAKSLVHVKPIVIYHTCVSPWLVEEGPVSKSCFRDRLKIASYLPAITDKGGKGRQLESKQMNQGRWEFNREIWSPCKARIKKKLQKNTSPQICSHKPMRENVCGLTVSAWLGCGDDEQKCQNKTMITLNYCSNKCNKMSHNNITHARIKVTTVMCLIFINV